MHTSTQYSDSNIIKAYLHLLHYHNDHENEYY